MNEQEIEEALKELISASLYYETTMRNVFTRLQKVDKEFLINLEKSSPLIKKLLTDFETIYERINNEI